MVFFVEIRKPLVTCDHKSMPANGTELPGYPLRHIAPELQGSGTTKEEEAPTPNNTILYIKLPVNCSEPLCVI